MKTYSLYQYETTETGTKTCGFLRLLNYAHESIPDERIRDNNARVSRKLIKKSVTLEQAESILRGRKLCSVEAYTYPDGSAGLKVTYTCYTLEDEYGIARVNPGVKEEIIYDGKTYHPQDAGARWGEDDE